MTQYTLDFSTHMRTIYASSGEKLFKLDNFFAEGQSDILKLGYLPPVVKSISPPLKIYKNAPEDRGYIVIVERKPMVGTLMPRMPDHTPDPVTISIPWHHYFIVINEHEGKYRLSDVGLYFSSTPLSSLDHVFYTPYLPCIETPRNGDALSLADDTHDLANMSIFDTFKPVMELNRFNELFDVVSRIVWRVWKFEKQPLDPVHNFVATYGFPPVVNYAEGSYGHALSALKQIGSIQFDQILSEKVLDSLTPAFTFSDYLKFLNTVADDSTFDFKSAFEKAYAAGEPVPQKPNALTHKRMFKNPVFTSSVNTTSNNVSFYTIETTHSIMSISEYTAQMDDTLVQFSPSLYQDHKKRWRRKDGTFASKAQIFLVRGF